MLAAATAAFAMSAPPALAEDGPFGLKLEGSFGEGGFDRKSYVPPTTHFVLNESPFVTTELRPIFVRHNIPEDFVTTGGDVTAVALQGRLAITERLGIIATTDGYADVNFDRVLPDDDGLLDIAAGVKYAVHFDPADQSIVSVGLRYTAPLGSLETAGIELTGRGKGYLNPFVTGAKTFGLVQLQGAAGAQIALSEDNWSYGHLHGHVNFRLTSNIYPFFEANALLPFDGGDQFASGTPVFGRLTGADILDIGAGDPVNIVTLGAGARVRINDNIILGFAGEANTPQQTNTVFDWRLTTDLVVHF